MFEIRPTSLTKSVVDEYNDLLKKVKDEKAALVNRINTLYDEKDELKAKLNRKTAMCDVAIADRDQLKREVLALESGTRKLKETNQVLGNFNKKLLVGLALDVAQGVYTGHFKTTNARFMELRRVAGLD